MWDLIHDRTHMRGDLPFDPFMIKQRMPYFLYSLEELRCDLTAFRESVKIEKDEDADPEARRHAKLVQYAVIFYRISLRHHRQPRPQLRRPRRPVAVRLDDQLHVLDWTDRNSGSLGRGGRRRGELGANRGLYWRSIDRPKMAHWLAAYELISDRHAEPASSARRSGRAARWPARRAGSPTRCSTTSPALDVYEASKRRCARHRVHGRHHRHHRSGHRGHRPANAA